MTVQRFICARILISATMCAGCSIQFELGDAPQTNSPGDAPALPDPNGQNLGLDAAQQARKDQVDRYIRDVIYKGGTVLASLPLPSGDVIDLVDRNTLSQLPYPLPALPFGPESLVLPEGVSMGLTELEQIPDFLELATTAAPFHRPSFWPYILGDAPDAVSVEDYLNRYQEGGAPSAPKRLYAGVRSEKPNRGVFGYMNQFRPEVEDASFSLIEFAVSCPAEGPAQELVGIVISVDKSNPFGINREKLRDGEARMHIEYATTVNGKTKYVWDGMDGHFVDNPFRLHQPGEKVPISIMNQSSVEHLMGIFQIPTGDWWIIYNGDLLGYYSASLFSMLNGQACRAAWYGEVLNKKGDIAIRTEMGSGLFAEAGIFKSAYVRNPKYFDFSWSAVDPKDEFYMAPYEPLCYNRTPLTYIGAPTNSSIFLLGGPGGKNPGCKWP